MKLLVITQTVDSRDTYLGFFVGWLTELAPRFDSIEVVCLKRGSATLPANVSVHSLGKEVSQSRLKYITRFYAHVWRLRRDYDAVFVHMNQEYVLLGAFLWKMLGKEVYLWRNHAAGSLLTSIAVALSDKTFCTSRFSYIAQSKKNTLMPIGVDIEMFRPVPGVVRTARSILFFGRFAPSKQPDVLVEGLSRLDGEWTASFVGSPLPKDSAFEASVRERVHSLDLANRITFLPGIAHHDAPKLFAEHEIYVNLAASGMYDKTLFEAAASGCLVLAASRDFAALAGGQFSFKEDGSDLAQKLEALLALPVAEKSALRQQLSQMAEMNSLRTLGKRLYDSIASQGTRTGHH